MHPPPPHTHPPINYIRKIFSFYLLTIRCFLKALSKHYTKFNKRECKLSLIPFVLKTYNKINKR